MSIAVSELKSRSFAVTDTEAQMGTQHGLKRKATCDGEAVEYMLGSMPPRVVPAPEPYVDYFDASPEYYTDLPSYRRPNYICHSVVVIELAIYRDTSLLTLLRIMMLSIKLLLARQSHCTSSTRQAFNLDTVVEIEESQEDAATQEMNDGLTADMMGAQPTLQAQLPVLSQPTLQAQLPVLSQPCDPLDPLDVHFPPYIAAKEFFKHIRGDDVIKNLNTASDPCLARDI